VSWGVSPHTVFMRRIALSTAAAVALALALLIAPRLVRFSGEDICLDNGGRLLRAARQCELAGGQRVPLYERPGDVRFWTWIGFVSLIPGALVYWAVHRATRDAARASYHSESAAAGAG
jgi:hypothetical protein